MKITSGALLFVKVFLLQTFYVMLVLHIYNCISISECSIVYFGETTNTYYTASVLPDLMIIKVTTNHTKILMIERHHSVYKD